MEYNLFFSCSNQQALNHIFFETLDICLQEVSTLDAIFCSIWQGFFFPLNLIEVKV